MDSLSRLIALFGLLLLVGFAHASGTVSGTSATSGWCINEYGAALCVPGGVYVYPTAQAAADDELVRVEAGNAAACTFAIVGFTSNATTGSYSINLTGGGGCPGTGSRYLTLTQFPAGCPSNSTAAGGVCTCNANYIAEAGITCVASTAASCTGYAEVLSGGSDTREIVAGTYPSTCFRLNGCNLQGSMAALNPSGTSYTVWGPYRVEASCSAAPIATPPADEPCPPPRVRGTVAGLSACVVPPVVVTTERTATTAPSGSASAPPGTVVGSEQTTTTCTGTQCMTTTTTRDASGAVTSSTTGTETRDVFCIENPDATICKQSSFAGVCSAGFACDGDAVQCAIAKDQHVRHCTLFESTGALRTTGEDAITRGDTKASDHPGASANVTTAAVGSMRDDTDLISGSCPADETVVTSAGLQSVVMPWSKLCTPATWLGNVLVGITSIAWLFIAFKRE